MKNGWEQRRLPDIAKYLIGLTYSPKDVSNRGIIVLRSSNIQDNKIDLSDLVRVNRPVNESLKVRQGDILMCSRNGSKRLVGKTALIGELPEDMTFGTFMTVVRSEFNPYLAWFFKSEMFRQQIGVGENTMINQVTKYMLDAIEVPLPSPTDQRRIVGLLDEAFEGIATAKANTEKNLQNARALFDSHLQSVFSNHGADWEHKHLREICDKITDGTHQTPTYYDAGVVFLSSRNVKSGRVDWDDIKYIDNKQHAEMHKRVAPRLNDILLAKNGTTGVAAIVDRETTFDIYVSLALLRARHEILPGLLLHFVNSPVAKEQFNKRLKGTGVPNLHLEEIREVVISFPKSLTEQKILATKLDSLREETEQLETIYRQKLTALEALKRSMLHQAFTGGL